MRDDRAYLWLEPCNPFRSLVERREGKDWRLSTVFCDTSHRDLNRVGKVDQVSTLPAWLQVIHDASFENVARGVRLPRPNLPRGFAVEVSPSDEVLGVTAREVLNYVKAMLSHLWSRRERLLVLLRTNATERASRPRK